MRRRIFIVGLLLSLIPLKSINAKNAPSTAAKNSISKSTQKPIIEPVAHDEYIVASIQVFFIEQGDSFSRTPLPRVGILNFLKKDLNIARGPPIKDNSG